MTKGWKIAALAVVVGVGTYVGLELLLPLFILVAVLQAHFIYLAADAESGPLARHRAL